MVSWCSVCYLGQWVLCFVSYVWQISGQEDLSYNIHDRRVFAPLWPSTVGIDDNCQYTTTQSPEPGMFVSVCLDHVRVDYRL